MGDCPSHGQPALAAQTQGHSHEQVPRQQVGPAAPLVAGELQLHGLDPRPQQHQPTPALLPNRNSFQKPAQQ